MNRRCLLGSSLTVACSLAMATSAFSETKTVTVKVSVDSQAPGYEGFRAIDGDPNTMWHTEFGFLEPAHPHEMILDLGASYELSGFGYLPRPGAGNGTIKDYECYLSDNDKEFGEPILKGTIAPRDGEHTGLAM